MKTRLKFVSPLIIACLVLAVIKLAGWVALSWGQVFAPLWLPAVMIVLLITAMVIALLLFGDIHFEHTEKEDLPTLRRRVKSAERNVIRLAKSRAVPNSDIEKLIRICRQESLSGGAKGQAYKDCSLALKKLLDHHKEIAVQSIATLEKS